MARTRKVKMDRSYPKGCFVPWEMECWLVGQPCKTFREFQNERRHAYPKKHG